MKRKILLHICCAPCAAEIINRLKQQDYEILLYFYSPNIAPIEEYMKRLAQVQKLSNHFGLKLEIENPNHKEWLEYVKGYENEPEGKRRCELCIRFRLQKAVQFAKKQDCDMFTTSLGMSHNKNTDFINKTGKELMQQYWIGFLEEDWGKDFEKSIKLAKELNLYIQKYCGCEFSDSFPDT